MHFAQKNLHTGWIRLQNGYYLPITSDDGSITFLKKVSTSIHSSNTEKRKLGSSTPLFRPEIKISTSGSTTKKLADNIKNGASIAALLEDKLTIDPPVTYEKTSISPKSNGKNGASELQKESVRPAVHMDAMAFGMGCCCLQITFQAKDVDESRFMYDQLAVVAPIMMALTASTPVMKGRLLDTDCRWGVISESVDDRTMTERGCLSQDGVDDDLAGRGKRRVYKSRYDCISAYIYQGVDQPGNRAMENRVLNMYNDIPIEIDESTYSVVRDAGIDPALAQHVAHLFIRDP